MWGMINAEILSRASNEKSEIALQAWEKIAVCIHSLNCVDRQQVIHG